MSNIEFISLRKFINHFFFILLIFIVLAILRYPIFLNKDYFFSGDDGLLASHILDILNGNQFIFYLPTGKTFGLTFGVFCAPFIWLLGPTTLAYSLPGTLFYASYLWTTYLIAKTLIPRTANLVFIMLFFTPYFITELSTHNWPHILTAFLGNMIILLFIKAKLSKTTNSVVIFFLFFTMGLAIYTYTYSIIFILSIGILYTLSHPKWMQIRKKMSLTTLINVFKNKKTKRETCCQILDLIIFLFFIGVIFSYIFGGFGLDIAGYSILQINKFHKAAMQLLGLIFLRTLIEPKSFILFFRGIKSHISTKVQPKIKPLTAIGVSGFLIGLFPRIASILIGETSRGGQGHDVDFSPIKVFAHAYSLFTKTGPSLFGVDVSVGSNLQYLVSNKIDIFWIILCLLFIFLTAIFFFSIASFISKNWVCLTNIVKLKSVQFKPTHTILLTPILVCVANIIVQNGSHQRYLFPLFGFVVLWIGIYVDKVKEKAKWFPAIVLVVWGSFYFVRNYQSFKNIGIIEGAKTVKLTRHPIHDIIEFLEEQQISAAYSAYGVATTGTYLSGGNIFLNEYSDNPTFKTYRRLIALNNPHFAIIATRNRILTYQNYLQEKNIEFKTKIVAGNTIFWDFKGNNEKINNLRYLIPN